MIVPGLKPSIGGSSRLVEGLTPETIHRSGESCGGPPPCVERRGGGSLRALVAHFPSTGGLPMTPAPPAPPTELTPRYTPGLRVSGFAFAPVLAGQFVKIAGDKLQIDTPNVLSGETVMPGDYRIAACGAGERAFGVAERSTPVTQVGSIVEVDLF